MLGQDFCYNYYDNLRIIGRHRGRENIGHNACCMMMNVRVLLIYYVVGLSSIANKKLYGRA